MSLAFIGVMGDIAIRKGNWTSDALQKRIGLPESSMKDSEAQKWQHGE